MTLPRRSADCRRGNGRSGQTASAKTPSPLRVSSHRNGRRSVRHSVWRNGYFCPYRVFTVPFSVFAIIATATISIWTEKQKVPDSQKAKDTVRPPWDSTVFLTKSGIRCRKTAINTGRRAKWLQEYAQLNRKENARLSLIDKGRSAGIIGYPPIENAVRIIPYRDFCGTGQSGSRSPE